MTKQSEIYGLRYMLSQQLESHEQFELRCGCGEIDLSDEDKKAVRDLLHKRATKQLEKLEA